MADGTVTGEYRLTTVQARRELGQLNREAAKADITAEKLGHDLDKVGSRQQVYQVRRYRVALREVGTQARSTERDTGRLRRETERLAAATNLAATGRRRGGGAGAGGVRGGMFGLSGGMKLMAGQAAIALPAVRALAGGLGALAAVTTSALGGAGAVGASGLLGLATGIGGVMAVAIPASKAISEAADAQKKYNDAVRQYGRASKEAGEARGAARIAFRNAPRGTRSLVSEANAFSAAWKRATKSGQESLVEFLRAVVRTGTRMRGPLAEISNQVTRSLSFQGQQGLRFLEGRRVQRGLRAGAGIFSENLGNVRRIGQATVEMFLDVARAARPFVKEFSTFTREFFERQAGRTRNIRELRSSIGGMVDDLKSLGRLGGAGGRLVLAIFGGGAPRREGRGLVDDATRQLNQWTDWIKRNPAAVSSFFRDTSEGLRTIAGIIRDLAPLLEQLAQSLTPVLAGLGQISQLAGATGLVGTVGLLAAGRGAIRGGRGAAGGRGLLGGLLGGGAAAAGGAAARGGLLRGALMGAGRAYWPIAAGMAGLNFLGTEGGLGRRLQGAAAGVLPFVHQPQAYSALEAQGQQRATQFVGGQGMTRVGQRNLAAESRRLGGTLNARVQTRATQDIFLDAQGYPTARPVPGGRTVRKGEVVPDANAPHTLTGDERKRVQAQKDAIDDEIAARRDLVEEIANERSVRNAGEAAADVQRAARFRLRRGDVRGAGRGFVRGTYEAMAARSTQEGKREVAQANITWLNEQRRRNPALNKVYDDLVGGIKRRFHKLGTDVEVVNGRIFKDTDSAWRSIARSISTQTERARQEATANLTAIQRQAVQGLMDMGWSEKDAKGIIKGQESITSQSGGKIRGQDALDASRGANVAGQRYAAQGKKPKTGDGAGTDQYSTRRGRSEIQQAATTTGTNLMGAKPGLGVYAADAATYGLRVSSGSRPGAVTVSGNTSYHSSGDALDLSGPADKMLAFASHLSSTAGPGLAELIHTPLGARQIKNGAPFTYGGAVAAGHYDHVHVADPTPPGSLSGARGTMPVGAAAGMGGITVTAPQSRFGGLIGANVNAASNLYAAGMNDRLSQITGPGASVAATGGGGSNREIGRQMMMASGWGGDQWAALDALWTGESNWNEKARNASSGATGIPQALPGSKMASAGADWLTNPATQIKWGLGYIRERYGSPSAAYAAWQQRSPHWYGRGGSGIYRKGALIGVGDSQPSGGSEHVTVRRLRPGQPANENATGGGINVVVQMHNVTIGSATEAKRIAKGLGEQIAREITSALREAPMAAVA